MDMMTATPAFREMKEYSNKLLEFAHANSNAAFDFAQRACRVKSPSGSWNFQPSMHARKPRS